MKGFQFFRGAQQVWTSSWTDNTKRNTSTDNQRTMVVDEKDKLIKQLDEWKSDDRFVVGVSKRSAQEMKWTIEQFMKKWKGLAPEHCEVLGMMIRMAVKVMQQQLQRQTGHSEDETTYQVQTRQVE